MCFTFGIGDSIEDLGDLIRIVDLDGDWMGILEGIQVEYVLELTEHKLFHPFPARLHLSFENEDAKYRFEVYL